jgi:hypothetical protein
MGGSATNANINADGVFTWIPVDADIGSHALNITGNDGTNSALAIQLIHVTGIPALSVNSVSASSTSPGNPITFTAVASNFEAVPVYTVMDNANGSTMTNANINSSTGAFAWTPTVNDVGQHTITVQASDSDGESMSTTITLYVQGAGSLRLTAAIPSSAVSAGSSVNFSAVPVNFSPISYALTDSFASSSINANNISQSGFFVWTPSVSDAGSHSITVTATEYGMSQTFATSTTITVTASQVVTPTSTSTPTPTPAPASTTTPGVTMPKGPVHVFAIFLKIGSRGQEVIELQKILIKKKFLTGDATGYYGALTEAAVKKYQKAHGIELLGVVGPSTRLALNADGDNSSSSDANAAVIATLLQQIQVLMAKIAELKAAQH